MKILKWLDENLEEQLMSVALWAIVVIMGIQVIMRYGFKSSLAWSEEVSRYLFIWMVFIGISYGIKKESHMRIDMLEHFVPVLRRPLGILVNLSFLVFAIYMISPGISVIEGLIKTGQTSPASEIPMYIVYSGLLVGFLLVVIRIVQRYVKQFIGKKPAEGEQR
jgi:TRAP-type C4-dicarboxylate transport system permease small subunit